jgi:hypothetical protein
MEVLLMVGIGVGLASVAGVRAFIPLLLVGLFSRLGIFDLPGPLSFLDDWAVLGVLLALAVLVSVLDKVVSLEAVVNWVQTPVRVAAGAVLFSAALGAGLAASAIPELVIGGSIAGVVSVLKTVLRPRAKVSAAGVSNSFLSTTEDLLGFVGGAIAVFVPFVSLLLVAFLLFFFYRIRRRRGRKYGGLRILGD